MLLLSSCPFSCKSINKRITDISCNQGIFDAAKMTYEQALSKSGFNEELKYNNRDSTGQIRNKKKEEKKKEDYMVQSTLSLECENQHWKIVF